MAGIDPQFRIKDVASRPNKRGTPSQSVIARDLGLSQATVSYALNGKVDRCGSRNYKRVWSRALAIGYRAKGLLPAATPLAVVEHVGIVHGAGLPGGRSNAFMNSVRWAIENRLAAREIFAIPLGSSD